MIDLIKNIIPRIGENYYSAINPLDRNTQRTAYAQHQVHPEQNFVAELFSQLRQAMPVNDGLQLNCNIYKEIRTLTYTNEYFQRSLLEILGGNQGVVPDLVYHQSQQDTNPQNQVFALECKVDPNLPEDAFNRDLIKLMIYKHQFNFQCVILLVANNNASRIEGLLNAYEARYYLNRDRLHILVVERHGVLPVCLIHRGGNCT